MNVVWLDLFVASHFIFQCLKAVYAISPFPCFMLLYRFVSISFMRALMDQLFTLSLKLDMKVISCNAMECTFIGYQPQVLVELVFLLSCFLDLIEKLNLVKFNGVIVCRTKKKEKKREVSKKNKILISGLQT